MKFLIVEPHNTLLSPQGSRDRLDGLLSLLDEHELYYLIPEGSEAYGLPVDRIEYFREPLYFGLAVPYFLHWLPSFRKKVTELVARLQIDVVIFHFPWGLAYSSTTQGVKRVYFSAGVEADFAPITLAHFRLNFPPLRQVFSWLIAFIEKRSCEKADLIITMSRADELRYTQLFGIAPEKLWTLSHPVARLHFSDAEKLAAKMRLGISAEPVTVLFHGIWNHLPNREAMLSLAQQIAPRCLKENNLLQFVVAGPNVPTDLGKAVKSLGFVADLETLLAAADIAVVPIYSGCGVRMKLFDYFRAGIPVVSTQKGAEGLMLEDGNQLLLVNDSPEAVAEGVHRLAGSLELRQKLADRAYCYIAECHDVAAIRLALGSRIKRTIGVVSTPRTVSSDQGLRQTSNLQ